MKAKLAFYKGKGKLFDRLIRWWTKSQYSHVEIKIGNYFYSSSRRDGGVRIKEMRINPNNWDIVDIPWQVDDFSIGTFFEVQLGKKYDWIGIIKSQFFGTGRHHPSHWFCSEICAASLKIAESYRYSPQQLFLLVSEMVRLKDAG